MTEFTQLLNGYARFRTSAYPEQKARYDTLSKGQNPGTMVISCADSRVSPSLIFDVGPGEIFTVRNVANLVPPFDPGGGLHGVSAAVEFAVTQLEVQDILVLGHGGCGGCQASLTDHFAGNAPGEGYFIASWIALLDEARDRVLKAHDGRHDAEALLALEHEAVRVSLKNLKSFPFIQERMADGRLRLHGGHFAVAHGMLHLLRDDDTFSPVIPMAQSD
ncbi:carbonic anhydrase [Pacificimonas sp. ICDLI1SI03]|jgi:carbonic anhydrase|tara:strand:+ start:11057 stop:11713 length:657 start_codon:yes stop_codon:yes gene_type:complete